jgi:steroid delta-isomerase-like uncharacterized protein
MVPGEQTMPTENEALVRGVIEVLFNQKRAHLIEAFYSPDCRGGSPDGPFDSCDAFRTHFEKYATAFPDFRLAINYMLLDGDRVAVHYTFLGAHAGQLAGYRSSGRTLKVPGMMISRIANRRIIEQHFLWDNLGPRRQLWLASLVERGKDNRDRAISSKR